MPRERASLRAIALAACATLAAACTLHRTPAPAPRPSSDAWTAFRLDRELDAVLDRPRDLAVRWTYRTRGDVSSSPTVADGTVFVGGDDRRVYALSLRTGLPRWIYAADDAVPTAPLVEDGVVVVGEGNDRGRATGSQTNGYLLLGDGANAIVGLDERTGKPLWKRYVPGSPSATGAIVDGAYVEHDGAGMLFAFAVADGSYRYRAWLESTAATAAADRYAGDAVVTAGAYPNAVIAVDGRSGATTWRTAFPARDLGFARCPLASDGARIFGGYDAPSPGSASGSSSATQHAYALDARTGRIAWDVALGAGRLRAGETAPFPTVAGGRVFVGDALAGGMTALDARTGRVLWRRVAGAPVAGGSAVANGVVYAGDAAGTLWALDARDGAVRGRTPAGDGFGAGSPLIAGDTLIAATRHGTIFARPLASLQRSGGQSPTVKR